MPPMRVVPAFDPFEYRQPGLGLGLEGPAIQHFAFQCREKAFSHGIVIGIANRAHRWHHAHLLAAFAESIAGVLTTLVGMMDDRLQPSLCQCHIERTEHEFRTQMRRHRPAYNAARPDIEHHRQIPERRSSTVIRVVSLRVTASPVF